MPYMEIYEEKNNYTGFWVSHTYTMNSSDIRLKFIAHGKYKQKINMRLAF